MQYLLTEEEYKALKADAQLGKESPSKDDLQKFCTIVADTMPAGVEWIGKTKPWGCVLTKDTEWYCDDCPARQLCPNRFKSWSK